VAIRQSTLEGLAVNPAFWQGKRVLLTGHTGFKGSWLSLWLQSMGAQVVGYALAPPTNPSLFEVADVATTAGTTCTTHGTSSTSYGTSNGTTNGYNTNG
jgi:hypothetical protein